ncbi:hypothetical protein Ahia01_000628300, partial [Argonauta hians]
APYTLTLNCTVNNGETKYSGRLSIRADFPVYAELKCRNAVLNKTSENESPSISFDLLQGYIRLKPQSKTDVCIMDKSEDATQYFAKLTLYGRVGQTLLVYVTCQAIICTYHNQAVVSTNSIQLSPPKLLPEALSSRLKRSLSLHVTDIKGYPIKSTLYLGKKVQLKSELVDKIDGLNFSIENCWAYNSKNRYQILEKGCGDGIVFPTNIGFTFNYGVLTSPFFEIFRLRGSRLIWFMCSVTFCNSVCPKKTCRLRAQIKTSNVKGHRKLIFNDDPVNLGAKLRSGHSVQSDVFYVIDNSRNQSFPLAQTVSYGLNLRVCKVYFLLLVSMYLL